MDRHDSTGGVGDVVTVEPCVDIDDGVDDGTR